MLSSGAAALTAVALAVAPAVSGLGLAFAQAAGCPDIEVVFARGTDEPPGVGRVGQAFVDALRGRVGGRSVGVYAVSYPATYEFLAAGAGANDASRHIQYMMANCPNTRLVLGGYSQGAAVIDIIAAVPFPAVGFDSPLPPNAPQHVAAISVFGNPTAKIGLPLTASPVWGAVTIDLCEPGDPVCSNGDNFEAHKWYVPGMTAQAADFVAGRL
ncbi:MAG: cutinase family protein [Mycobacterium sp.]|nr:cutinase family protein [Mycobacterium sp.]